MQCQYIYPSGQNMSLQCKNKTAFKHCTRHTEKRLYEVEFHDFLEHVCNIDPSRLTPNLYDHCFKAIKKYVKYNDSVSREYLMDEVCEHLTGLKWSELDEDESQLDIYTCQRRAFVTY